MCVCARARERIYLGVENKRCLCGTLCKSPIEWPGKSSAFPGNCMSLEHIHNTVFCELESPRSSIKGPFVFGYLFMDLLPSFLKMMSDTLHFKKCFYV